MTFSGFASDALMALKTEILDNARNLLAKKRENEPDTQAIQAIAFEALKPQNTGEDFIKAIHPKFKLKVEEMANRAVFIGAIQLKAETMGRLTLAQRQQDVFSKEPTPIQQQQFDFWKEKIACIQDDLRVIQEYEKNPSKLWKFHFSFAS